MDRNPPAAVRRALRSEVGFGCPVDQCGSPYLTWHHFDPPWHERQHHDPDGMIALCLQHHKEADVGTFTGEQLKAFKFDPFLKRVGEGAAGRFNWKREQLVLEAGGGLFVRCQVFLEMRGRPVVWLTADEDGNQLMNLDLWDSEGRIAFSMRDNDWTAVADLHDLEVPPSARSVVLRDPRKDIRVGIEFSRTTLEEFEAEIRTRGEARMANNISRWEREIETLVAEQSAPSWYIDARRQDIARAHAKSASDAADLITAIRRGWSREDLVKCSFEARLPFPVPIHITQSKITLPGVTLSGATAIDTEIAIAV